MGATKSPNCLRWRWRLLTGVRGAAISALAAPVLIRYPDGMLRNLWAALRPRRPIAPAPSSASPLAPLVALPWYQGPVVHVLVLADTDAKDPSVLTRHADLIVGLGDLDINTVRWYAERVGDPPILAVHGNHDPAWDFPVPIESVHGRVVERLGLRFGGLSGCLRYKMNGNHQYDEAEASAYLQAMSACDVVLSHAPPAGTHDRPDDASHRGTQALADYVDQTQPMFLLHGHQHIDMVSRRGPTYVVGTYGARWLELPLPHAGESEGSR